MEEIDRRRTRPTSTCASVRRSLTADADSTLRLKTKRAVVEKERKVVALDDLFFFAMGFRGGPCWLFATSSCDLPAEI